MKIFLFWLTLSILCVAGITGHAQIFPIQSQVNLTPPYSGNLSDYTFPGSQRITVTLHCNDITISNYRVKLRFAIEGLGITLRSKANLSLEPFILDGGSPLLLYGDDLAQYLDPRNLDFIGISRTEYQRTGKLPEGVYRFYVEVLDYNRGTVVSNKAFATAWVILNDPPILNLPANNSKTRIVDPTNIPFTWTPRHSSSPNSAFTSEYVVRLIEIWPSNRNPNDAFLSQTPLYEVETSRTQIVYGPGEPLLIPGRKYAWQVQAKDVEGRDLFKNNGKSEVFVFQFGDAIEMPQNVRKETTNATTISIRWEASTVGEIPERFRIRYRPEGGARWYEDVTTNYWHTLSGLQNNKAYDIQVRAETSRQVSDYTLNQRYSTTLPIVDENFQCGNPFNIVPPLMTTPLQFLNPGDIFKCADFDVMVTEVTKPSTPGNFSGKGYAKVLMMNRANIEVTFNGTFNSERQMVTGSIKTTYQSGNKMAQLTEVMKSIGEKPPVLDSVAANPDSNLIIITGVIDSVYFNSKGEIVVLDEGGSTQTFEQKKNGQGEKQEMIVKDSGGNTWTVDKDGKITAAESAVAGVFSSPDSLKFTVNFRENSSDQYGFDKDSNFPTPDKIQINSADYVVGWKSVEQGKQDFVDAFTLTENKFPKKVGFKIESQPMSLQPGTEPSSTKLILPGALHGDRQELIAYAKLKEPGSTTETDVVLGKLKVATYEYISRKVIIVPVNGVTPPVGLDVQAKLNKIYGQAVAGWQVTIADTFKVAPEMLSKFDEEESGTFASYNKKMREFNSAYRNANPTYDRNAFYIFLIPGGGYRFNGFMPFKRGIGYVFINKTTNQVHTIAHELGHGAFNLRHTFDEHSLAQNTTDNLMDYKGGEELKKYQWDYVHDPESMVGWLQDDEESAMKKLKGDYTIYVGDSIMRDGKVFINAAKGNKLQVKYIPIAGDTGKIILGKISHRPEWSKNDISFPVTTWAAIPVDKISYFPMDSLPAGSYRVLLKNRNNEIDTIRFFLRTKKHDYACAVCGRNLELTIEEMKTIFPNSSKLEDPDLIDTFNQAFKKSGYKTCNHIAHTLAQIKTESGGLTKSTEGTNYYLHRMLEVFKNNAGTDFWINQNFYDQKTYMKYVSTRVYEKMDSAKYDFSVDSTSFETFSRGSGSIIIPKDYPSHNEHSPAFNGYEATQGSGYYKPVTFSTARKEANGKRMLNVAYKGMNGNSNDTTMANAEGYRYRGRGFVQVTGKTNYENAQETCKQHFGVTYNFVSQPQLMEENVPGVWASFAWFFKNVKLIDLDTQNPDIITYKVNARGLEKDNRRANYVQMRNNLLKCNSK